MDSVQQTWNGGEDGWAEGLQVFRQQPDIASRETNAGAVLDDHELETVRGHSGVKGQRDYTHMNKSLKHVSKRKIWDVAVIWIDHLIKEEAEKKNRKLKKKLSREDETDYMYLWKILTVKKKIV